MKPPTKVVSTIYFIIIAQGCGNSVLVTLKNKAVTDRLRVLFMLPVGFRGAIGVSIFCTAVFSSMANHHTLRTGVHPSMQYGSLILSVLNLIRILKCHKISTGV